MKKLVYILTQEESFRAELIKGILGFGCIIGCMYASIYILAAL